MGEEDKELALSYYEYEYLQQTSRITAITANKRSPIKPDPKR